MITSLLLSDFGCHIAAHPNSWREDQALRQRMHDAFVPQQTSLINARSLPPVQTPMHVSSAIRPIVLPVRNQIRIEPCASVE